jgi:transposase InsO family protein
LRSSFPIQRIQTDRGREFFAYCFQEKLMEYAIKFRPSQRTDLEEFYPTVDLKAPDLSVRLREWQDHYNHYRPHGSLGGRTPWEVWWERARLTPLYEEVEALYDASAERIRHPAYSVDLQLAATHKRSEKSPA